MEMPAAISSVIDHRDLTAAEMQAVMHRIMSGEATPAQIGGFLVGLRMKGETVEEIAAAAAVMRELATTVNVSGPHLVDTCGTGGDGVKTFNISTACAFVVAGAGGKVAKHGNRSISSKSGSADVLEAAGVNLELNPEQVAQCINEVGVGFMFAPKHHNAMKYAIGPRREMGVRTIFNVLGPLTNPAGAPSQVVGVFSNKWVESLAKVLARLGSHHVMVVHAEDGLDEISIAASTFVAEVKQGKMQTYMVTPEQCGIARGDVSQLVVEDAEQSLVLMRQVFDNTPGPARDIVSLNAGAAIYVSGLSDTLEAGVKLAQESIASGMAREKFEALIKLSKSLSADS
ncbi:MAG: anthranilate phosphoribosyltransferase [Gammaproteobacteria bacterium]|nr:anthranilate phosphoribosyltransferase [Gammaproteobacteria bacterium]